MRGIPATLGKRRLTKQEIPQNKIVSLHVDVLYRRKQKTEKLRLIQEHTKQQQQKKNRYQRRNKKKRKHLSDYPSWFSCPLV
jgi:hypothetical protein